MSNVKTESLEIAAQCWCDPETSHVEMNHYLAAAFASRLEPYLNIANIVLKWKLAEERGDDKNADYVLDSLYEQIEELRK